MDLLPLDNLRGAPRLHASVIGLALVALARAERRGERPATLTDTTRGEAAWRRFQRHLKAADFIALALENAAVTQPFAYDLDSIVEDEAFAAEGWRALGRGPNASDALAREWLENLAALTAVDADAEDFIVEAARSLRLPTRLARSDLHKLKPHHHAIELPGTGGQLAMAALAQQPELALQDVFTIIVASWQERLLAGLVAVEQRLYGTVPIASDPTLTAISTGERTVTHVFGLDESRGGHFSAERLHILFPHADIQLI